MVREATLVVKHTDSSGFHYLNWSPVSLHTLAVEVYFATFGGRHLNKFSKVSVLVHLLYTGTV